MKEGPGLSYSPLYPQHQTHSTGVSDGLFLYFLLPGILEMAQKDLLNESSQQPYEVDIMILILQIRKLNF